VQSVAVVELQVAVDFSDCCTVFKQQDAEPNCLFWSYSRWHPRREGSDGGERRKSV